MNKPIFKRFRTLSKFDLLSDMHIHTVWTDGENTSVEMLDVAVEKGLRMIAFTDHVRKNSSYCKDFVGEIKTIARNSKIELYAGFEAKIKDFNGNLDIPEYCSRNKHLIIGSVHSIPVDNGKFLHPEFFKPLEKLQECEYRLYLGLLKSGQADILGHVGGMSNSFAGGFSMDLMEDLILKCAATETAFEINSRYHSNIIKELLVLLEKYNPAISIGSDAHNVSETGECLKLLRKHRVGK